MIHSAHSDDGRDTRVLVLLEWLYFVVEYLGVGALELGALSDIVHQQPWADIAGSRNPVDGMGVGEISSAHGAIIGSNGLHQGVQLVMEEY